MKQIAFSLLMIVPLGLAANVKGQDLAAPDLTATQARDLGLFYEYIESGGNVRKLKAEAAFKRARLRERAGHRAANYRANYRVDYRLDYRAPYMTRRR